VAFIKLIQDGEARGLLAEIYRAARERAGRVWNIVRVMSRRPAACKASLDLYREIMHGPSGLTRAERELVATAVSSMNRCGY